jgi:type VI secretion system secreted protein Hcp
VAFDAFLKFTGDEIKGESTRKDFEGAIEILSFSMGASNPVTIDSSSAGIGAGKANLSSFNFMKHCDAASPLMFQACCKGDHFPKVKVTLRKAGGTAPVDYLTYEFEKCFLESVQWSGSSGGDDRPIESSSMAYGKVTVTYTPQDEKGNPVGKPQIGTWDVTTVDAK